MRIKKALGCLTACLVVLLIPVVFLLYLLFAPAPVYETNDIADYGVVKGNYDNERPKEFIFYFFPKAIEGSFSNISYHYKAKKLDTYAYEAYLEFVIEDTDAYTSFLSSVIGDGACEAFYFDAGYQIYYVSNYLHLFPGIKIIKDDTSKSPRVVEEDESLPPSIENAKTGAVLFSDTEQRIIFWALGVYDGGGTSTDELNYFFNRFGIDPLKYEKRATPGIS